MVTATLVFMAVMLSFVSAKSSFYPMKFFAGVAWWGLGAWLIYNPLVTGANPVNDIMLTFCFFFGFAMMIFMNWRTATVNGREISNLDIKLPRWLGGRSEEEAATEARFRDVGSRRESYRERLENASRGRR